MVRVVKFLKPYVLKIFFSNNYVSAQVVHSPTSTTIAAASTMEKDLRKVRPTRKDLESGLVTDLRPKGPSTTDVAAAAKIGELLAERLKLKEIHGVMFELRKGERYHGKRRALLDSLRQNGVKLI